MTTFLVAHDITLTQGTINAWTGQGGYVTKALRGPDHLERIISRTPTVEFVLSLGSRVVADDILGIPVINPVGTVSHLWTPGSTRRALDSVLPPVPEPGHTDWWLKGPGFGGTNKQRFTGPAYESQTNRRWDTQIHIEGTEYRVITVGGRIVQQYKRSGPNGARRYNWLRRDALPDLITDIIARTTRDMGTYTLVAWDTIHDADRGYILEGNCCPGVKPPTAARIVKAVRRLVNAINT